jgi:cation:H+ antiporter
MTMDVLWAIGGAVMLYFGAEWLVGGASQLAASMRIPQLIVGLTVVAYGTSAPEIVVGLQSAGSGHGDVALGNVIGSNIANLGLILALAVLVRPPRVDGELRGRELPVLLASTLALPVVLRDGRVSVGEALLLVLGAVAYTAWTVRGARLASTVMEAREAARYTAEAADEVGAPPPAGRLRPAMVAAVGLLLLIGGGHAFVHGATGLARGWGMSERVLGLTIVAIGTSLPELATSTVAALRGHADIAVGNVVGSNIFNALLCLGSAALVGPVGGPPAALMPDLAVLLLMTMASVVFLRAARTMRRWEGVVLLAGYLAFLVFLART